jgi:hypothetical protein
MMPAFARGGDARLHVRANSAIGRRSISKRHTLGIIILGAVTYAAFITLRGLWVVPLLADRHG